MNRPSIAQARCIEHNRLRTGSVGRFEGAEAGAGARRGRKFPKEISGRW
jgi:hypothetical protein